MFAGNTRLPMVAGWDGLLPAWFTPAASRATGRRSTRSCLVAACSFIIALAGLIGVGKQEAFQLLWNASGSSTR